MFLAARGVSLPRDARADELDYEALVYIFMSPDAKTPGSLVDALYLVDEMSTPEGLDALLSEATQSRLPLDPAGAQSPADVAVHVWLLDQDVLERKHAEQLLTKVRSYQSFQTDHPLPAFKPPSNGLLAQLANTLDGWFEAKKRGRGARVLMFERDDGVWFLVRHGDPLKREESLNDGREPSSVCFRPSKHDVLVYQPTIGELRINARSKGEKDLYRKTFGHHLFGDVDFFPAGTEKFTLDPLRDYGEASLVCTDIPGLDWIRLREVQFFYGGTPYEVVTRKSTDLFALLKARERDSLGSGRIIRAGFLVKFTDAKTPRSVIIKPSNIAQYTRDDDSVLVEAWLRARGFIIPAPTKPAGHTGKILATADA